MQNANTTCEGGNGVRAGATIHPQNAARNDVFAFCILNFELLRSLGLPDKHGVTFKRTPQVDVPGQRVGLSAIDENLDTLDG